MAQKLISFCRLLVKVMAFVLLTLITQIGGLVYGVTLFTFRHQSKKHVKRFCLFTVVYLLVTFIVVPSFAPFFGREKLSNSALVQPHNWLYVIANRNYVTPELNRAVSDIAEQLNARFPGIQLVYLDACFPFIDGFPLLPHLSHNDGKKLDVTFIYQNETGEATNLKRSVSGYGIYEEARHGEFNQSDACKSNGHWRYDLTKYLTFGGINKGIELAPGATKALLESILAQDKVGKVFIEPHLKTRLGMTSCKIRFHGCGAVRHDDHIHLQVQ